MRPRSRGLGAWECCVAMTSHNACMCLVWVVQLVLRKYQCPREVPARKTMVALVGETVGVPEQKAVGLQHQNGSLFPAELLWIENWAVNLAGRVKAKDIKKRIASLRSYHVDMGYNTEVFANEQLARVVRGVMRLYPDTSSPRERTHITREILLQLLPQLDLCTKRGALLAAAFTLAFAAFLRSVAQHPGDRFCPVRMMANYFRVCPPGSMREPLFIQEGYTPFTREYLVRELQSMASAVRIWGNFTGHSFRWGAAT